MGSRLYRDNVRFPALFAGAASCLACFPFWFLLNYVDGKTNIVVAVLISFVAGAPPAAVGPIVKATLTNVTLPKSRGLAFALFNTFDDFGRGVRG